MMSSYPVRVRIGMLFIIVFALLSSGIAVRRALHPPPWTTAQDEISRYEARFRLLKTVLPPRGVVGYLPELLPASVDLGWGKDFFLTRYALAPLIVVSSTAPPLVIGNFRSAGPDRSIPDPTLVLVRDFGDGVLLFRHERR